MKKPVECVATYTDESQRNYGETDLETAVDIFKTLPWKRENVITDETTECFPSICFGRLPIKKESEYLNISGVEEGGFFLMIEAFKPTKILGLIPWYKSAYLDMETTDESLVETFIRRFYTLSALDLFEWISEHKSRSKVVSQFHDSSQRL